MFYVDKFGRVKKTKFKRRRNRMGRVYYVNKIQAEVKRVAVDPERLRQAAALARRRYKGDE